jgi:hypothetical protein
VSVARLYPTEEIAIRSVLRGARRRKAAQRRARQEPLLEHHDSNTLKSLVGTGQTPSRRGEDG